MRDGKLKPGWRRVKFGEVVRQVKDRVDPAASGLTRYVAGEHMDTDDLRIRRWGEINGNYLGPAFHMRFRPGHVLYGSRRTYLRKVAVADFEGICANTTYVLEPKGPSVLLPELLPYIMQTESFHEHSIKQSKGSVNPYINFSDLEWYEFALPPVDEQARIAEAITTAWNTAEALRAYYEAGHRLLRSYQRTHFIAHPEGEIAKLGTIAEVQNGTTPSRANARYWGGHIPWLPTGKVNERIIRAADEFITKEALTEYSLNVVSAGSTLVAMIGQGQTRGKAARLEIDACINQNFGAVTPKGELDAWYLFYQLEASYSRLRAWSQGTNQHALNASLLRTFPVWVPNKHRQVEIASELRTIDDGVASVQRRLQDAQRLVSSLRERSLRGVGWR